MPSQKQEVNQQDAFVDLPVEDQQEPYLNHDVQDIRIPDEIIITWKVELPTCADSWSSLDTRVGVIRK